MKILWDGSYSIGNEIIDGQHRDWIDYYNHLDDAMNSKDRVGLHQTKVEILSKTSDYVDQHFKFEEDYMRSIGFPDTDKHWRQHKNFRNKIYQLCRKHEEGTIVLSSEIMDMIKKIAYCSYPTV